MWWLVAWPEAVLLLKTNTSFVPSKVKGFSLKLPMNGTEEVNGLSKEILNETESLDCHLNVLLHSPTTVNTDL